MRFIYKHKYRLLFGLFILFILFKYLNISDQVKIEKVEQISSNNFDKYQIYLKDLLNKNYYYYKYKTTSSVNDEIKLVDEKSLKRKNEINKEFYLILEYTQIFFGQKYCNLKIKTEKSYSNHVSFKRILEDSQNKENSYDLLDECLYKNCFFTCDRTLANQANVLLFHETDLKNELNVKYDSNLGKIRRNLNNIAPFNQRSSSQIWLLWNDEANIVESNLDIFQFNWTMSYKSNSEISYGAYGIYNYKFKKNDDENFEENLKIEFKKRSNQIVWFNSNCLSKLRIEYARNISIYYPLHVRGKCTSAIYSETNDKFSTDNLTCLRDSKCEMDLLQLNKFYLAFESKNCSDYITEKFWRSLSLGILPIVFQPAKKFYERLAPLNSFIHFEDFEHDALKLINHLKNIENDFTLYRKYFEWKSKYDIIYDMKLEKIRMCELCAKLNNENDEIYYKSVSKFFNNECFSN